MYSGAEARHVNERGQAYCPACGLWVRADALWDERVARIPRHVKGGIWAPLTGLKHGD
jgi:hypothetical protein